MPVINRIADFHADMTEWRHDFHAHPALGFEEVRTSGIVAEKLRGWGIETHTGIAKTGVVGVLHGAKGKTGRAIGLRADMDALPMTETNGFAHASTIPGKMHGCGHDGHTTMLLGAARYLAETRNFDGTVYLIFQPAEEGHGGGRVMVEEGLFERFPMESVYGMHNWPELGFGRIAAVNGPIMAASDRFTITVRGKGGHAAMPHFSIDPVPVAAQIVSAAQTLVSRKTDPFDQAVVSFTMINAGSAFNVIPDAVEICGTCRSLTPAVRERLEKGLETLSRGIAEAMGCSLDFHYLKNFPPTINTAAATEFAAGVAAKVVGGDKVDRDVNPSMGAEDFAFMLEKKPGCYIWLGADGGPNACHVHNPNYDFNDALLPIGATYWAQLVETALPKAAS